ncbi:hypothetical protein F5877DRAFT_86778 [Lentinula edodes]|nr:hypothetical protein F5877DRAFT_86778 [Lentinula edodes]
MRTSQILETDLPNMESEGSDDVYEQNPVIQQYIADEGTIVKLPRQSLLTKDTSAADSRGGVHCLHYLPIRLACLYHLHHHLWMVRQTREVESTASTPCPSDSPASTTSTTTSGSCGRLARWSPPPLPPSPPLLDRAVDSQGGVHHLRYFLIRLACLYHLHHLLWIMWQTREVESTTSSSVSPVFGSYGGAVRCTPQKLIKMSFDIPGYHGTRRIDFSRVNGWFVSTHG